MQFFSQLFNKTMLNPGRKQQFHLQIYYLMLFLFILLNSSCVMQNVGLPVVSKVDLERYSGTWYEIARLPNRFEEGLKCVTATYELLENGKIRVINRGHQVDNPSEIEEVKGKAKIPNASEPGKLKVTFFWPFYGKYWILDLDESYQYVLVGSPSRKYLWILSREKTLAEEIMNTLKEKADDLGFHTQHLYYTPQDCKH